MKLIIFILTVLLSVTYGQISVAPIFIELSNNEKVADFYVKNVSEEDQEVNIISKFGYPITDSLGNVTMLYLDDVRFNKSDTLYSLEKHIKFFPKRFYLKPGNRQLVRFLLNIPPNTPEGLYWSRIITSSEAKEDFSDPNVQEDDIQIDIKFRIEQITTLFYKKGKLENQFTFDSLYYHTTDHFVEIYYLLSQNGNAPFLGTAALRIADENGNLKHDASQKFIVYHQALKKFVINKDILEGKEKWFVGVTILPERDDINIQYDNINEKIMKIMNVQLE